jgi:hypothetical protein
MLTMRLTNNLLLRKHKSTRTSAAQGSCRQTVSGAAHTDIQTCTGTAQALVDRHALVLHKMLWARQDKQAAVHITDMSRARADCCRTDQSRVSTVFYITDMSKGRTGCHITDTLRQHSLPEAMVALRLRNRHVHG